jgi:hypothetical protein
MAKLETEINQIYLVNPDSKKTSLILHEEQLREGLHLFMVFELTDIRKKTEANDLKKISEAVLGTFHENRKLPAGTIFETTLAQINQRLGDIAHKGSRSWLGKFSAVLALCSDSEIFLSNSGQASAWVRRKNDFSEILGSEKKGEHPLKIFLNLASGRIKENDYVILTTSSLFNFVSLELLTKILSQNTLDMACVEVSQILQDSASPDDAFAAFFLQLVPATAKVAAGPEPEFAPIPDKQPEPAQTPSAKAKPAEPEPLSMEPIMEDGPIYAPLPEDLKAQSKEKFRMSLPDFSNFKKSFRLSALKKIRLPNFKHLGRFADMSNSAKFFLVSAGVCLILILANVAVVSHRSKNRKHNAEVAQAIDAANHAIADAETQAIINDDDEAVRLLQEAAKQLSELKQLDPKQYVPLQQRYQEVSDRVNRVTTISGPAVIGEVKSNPTFLARAGDTYLMANADINSLGSFATYYNQEFLLNSPDGEVTGLNHVPALGNLILTAKTLYAIDGPAKTLVPLQQFSSGSMFGLKFVSPNRMYVADRTNNQIFRLQLNGNKISSPVALLKTPADLSSLKDFGMDADIYLLYSDKLLKFVNGRQQAYQLDELTTPMTGATKLFVGTNLYILEPGQKRLLIFSKAGNLLNQVYFPNSGELTDFYVDETARHIDLINGNSLIEITF